MGMLGLEQGPVTQCVTKWDLPTAAMVRDAGTPGERLNRSSDIGTVKRRAECGCSFLTQWPMC